MTRTEYYAMVIFNDLINAAGWSHQPMEWDDFMRCHWDGCVRDCEEKQDCRYLVVWREKKQQGASLAPTNDLDASIDNYWAQKIFPDLTELKVYDTQKQERVVWITPTFFAIRAKLFEIHDWFWDRWSGVCPERDTSEDTVVTWLTRSLDESLREMVHIHPVMSDWLVEKHWWVGKFPAEEGSEE